MVSTYRLGSIDDIHATLDEEVMPGRSVASDSITGQSQRPEPGRGKSSFATQNPASVLGFDKARTRTNWLTSAVAGCLTWAAYQWRAGQTAACVDSLFRERLAERTRIAQDLHDTLLQDFFSASMQLHVANDQLPADSPAKPLVGRALELMNHTAENSRKAVQGLRSSWDLEDLEKAFSRVPEEWGVENATDYRVVVAGRARQLHPGICDEIYRVGREALANAFHHSQAGHIEIELEYAEKHLRMVVRDDGRGIDTQILHSGRDGHWGMPGMRERAERIGAKLKVWSREGSGTEIELSVPGDIAFRSDLSSRGLDWFGRSRWQKKED